MSNLETIDKICNHYEKVTNIKCDYIPLDKIKSGEYKSSCALCKKLVSLGVMKENCIDIFKYSNYQAQRFGGKYIFFCSIGLAHWCSNVSLGNDDNGIIVAGPVTIINPQEYIEDEIFPKLDVVDPKIAIELYNLAQKIPKIEPDIVTSLSEILHNSVQYEIIKQIPYKELDINLVDNVKELKITGEIPNHYSISKEKELLSLIKQSNEKKAKEILNEVLTSLFVSEGLNLKILRSRVFELIVLLSRTVVEVGVEIEEVFGINCYLLDDVYRIDDLDELLRWSNDILNKFMDLVFGLKNIKNKDIIFKSIAYLNKNYMCHVTLEQVAEHVALSPAYFSSVFKKEMQVNFSDYLNKIRIENSKKLLLDSNIKLVEISYLVGFESQSYFTKVFKKSEGITPKQYRQANVIDSNK